MSSAVTTLGSRPKILMISIAASVGEHLGCILCFRKCSTQDIEKGAACRAMSNDERELGDRVSPCRKRHSKRQ